MGWESESDCTAGPCVIDSPAAERPEQSTCKASFMPTACSHLGIPKVCQLESAVGTQQHVLCFDVPALQAEMSPGGSLAWLRCLCWLSPLGTGGQLWHERKVRLPAAGPPVHNAHGVHVGDGQDELLEEAPRLPFWQGPLLAALTMSTLAA